MCRGDLPSLAVLADRWFHEGAKRAKNMGIHSGVC